MSKQSKERVVKNFYDEPQLYYSLLPNLSATKVRKLCEEIERAAKTEVAKLGNPAKIMFDSEEDLLVCLGVQEPDVTVTI